jgi:2-acylglycerol O-acyltransferase 2
MLDYFEYEQIIECSPVDVRRNILNGITYLIPAQPHGVLSFCGICSAVSSPEFIPLFKSAVASAVLSIPIIKHVMGLFGLCDASKATLRKELKSSSVVLYVGGIAELFLSSPTEERLFLYHRKGFIKLALTEGVDVVPIYCFGNTSILTIVKTGFLAQLSRKMQVSFTYFWGKFGLPIPRDEKVCAYFRGC